jgi:MFS family permease
MLVTVCRRTFESVRLHRNYRLFFAGQVVSQIGTWVQKVAQTWFVLSVTHSGAALGIVVLCQFAPYSLLGLFGGALCDRFDQHRTLIASQTLMMVCSAVLWGLAAGGTLQVWAVDAIAAIQGTIMVVDTPVRQAFVVQMVGRAQLPNAIALNVSVFNLARMIGPALGGVAIAAFGVPTCFLLNAVSFLAVLVALLFMRRAELHLADSPSRGRFGRTVLRDTGDALRQLVRSRPLSIIVALVVVMAVLGTSFNVTLPLVAQNVLRGSATVLGVLLGCYGAGALVGALGMAALNLAGWRPLLWSCGAMGALQLVLAVQRSTVGAALAMVAIGVSLSCFTSSASATLQSIATGKTRVRMLSIYAYGWSGTAPLSGLLAGWLSDRGGPGLMFLVAGLLLVGLAGAATLVLRAGRGLGSDTPSQDGPG